MLDQNVQQENGLTPTGKGLDLSFLGKPHEHDPRRVYSTTSTDWQARVDFDRLRKDRLARARMMMEKHDLGALVCFVGENVRYITSVFQGNWKNNIFIRYCVLPRDGDPVLFETAGSDLECAKIDAPWLNGNIRPAITWKWSRDGRDDDGRQDGPVDRSTCSRRTASRRSRSASTSTTRARAAAFERLGPRTRQRVAGDVGRPHRQDAGRDRVPEDLLGDRRHVVLEDRERVAEAGRQGELHHREGQRVPLRAGLRLRLRHHRRLGRQHQPVPALAHRQGDPRGRPRDRRPERGRPGRLLRRLRALLQGRRRSWTPKEKDLYKECYESMYAAIER